MVVPTIGGFYKVPTDLGFQVSLLPLFSRDWFCAMPWQGAHRSWNWQKQERCHFD